MALPPVGIQLNIYGSKYNVKEDIDLILDSVARSGYAAVEAGTGDPEAFRARLDARGLVLAGVHVTMPALEKTADLVSALRILGGADVCNSGILRWGDLTVDDYKQSIPKLNEAGRALRAEGVHLHYHNHDFEYKPIDGATTGMDLLLDGLDPEAVDLCVDVAWVQKGGADPVRFLADHKDRIGYLHFKDYEGDEWRELGNGVVDFPALMEVLPSLTNLRWTVVEQDSTSGDPIDCAEISRKYLKHAFGY